MKSYSCDWCHELMNGRPNYTIGEYEHYCSRLCMSKNCERLHFLLEVRDPKAKAAYYMSERYTEFKALQKDRRDYYGAKKYAEGLRSRQEGAV
jgi:hypothetical protein